MQNKNNITWYHQEQGQTLVEAAFVIPILLMILVIMSTIAFGISWQYTLNNIAHSAVSAMAISGRQCEGEKILNDAFNNVNKNYTDTDLEIVIDNKTIIPNGAQFFKQKAFLPLKISYKINIYIPFANKDSIDKLMTVSGLYTAMVQRDGSENKDVCPPLKKHKNARYLFKKTGWICSCFCCSLYYSHPLVDYVYL